MYFNVIVISVILFIFPACDSKCSTFYILMEEYYDDVFGVNSFRPISEKINWERYTLKSNNTELEEFKKECVIYLHCNEIEVKQCVPSIPITNRYGVDERHIINPDNGTRYNTNAIENNVLLTKNNTNAVLTTNNNKTADEYIELIEWSRKDLDGNKLNKTHEPIIAGPSGSIDGKPAEEPKHGVFGETSTQNPEEKSTNSKALAGNIVAGTLGAAASVAAIVVASKFILGCMQSGAYRIPDAC